MSGAKVLFAPIPERAMGDGRLSALDWRVLTAIAFHDRMSATPKGKGRGCFASRATLAGKVGCDASSLSKAVRRLIGWGYVLEERQTSDRRKMLLRVSYEHGASEIGGGAATYCPINGGEPDTHSPDIGGAALWETGAIPPETPPQYIPLKGGIHSVETERIFRISGRTAFGDGFDELPCEARLSIIDRAYDEGQLFDAADWADYIAEHITGSGDRRLDAWAERICEKLKPEPWDSEG